MNLCTPPARTLLFRSLTITLAVMAFLATVLSRFAAGPRFRPNEVIHRFGFFVFVQGGILPEPTKQAPHDEENVEARPRLRRRKKASTPGEPDAAAASQVTGL